MTTAAQPPAYDDPNLTTWWENASATDRQACVRRWPTRSLVAAISAYITMVAAPQPRDPVRMAMEKLANAPDSEVREYNRLLALFTQMAEVCGIELDERIPRRE